MAMKTSLPATAMVASSTATLLERAGQGDQLAWRQLVDQYDKLVRRVAASFRLQSADILDVAQMTWLRLVENLHGIREPERLLAWLAVTAARESLRTVRKYSRHDLTEMVDDTADPSVDIEAGVADRDAA